MAITAQEAARRLREAGTLRGDRYQIGTEGKGQKWSASKERAKLNFVPAMQAALANSSFQKGLDGADASDYDNGVRGKGRANWSTGMQSAEGKYAKNISKFVPLWGQELPTPREQRGSAANLQRMAQNAERFRQAKVA